MILRDLPLIFLLVIALVVLAWGLCLGSFTTCVMYRVPRRISIWKTPNGSHRSFCPNCHAELHYKDLIPVFSWLFQRGKCRYCGIAIPVRYVLIELTVMLLVVALAFIFGLTGWFLAVSLLIPVLAGILSLLGRQS